MHSHQLKRNGIATVLDRMFLLSLTMFNVGNHDVEQGYQILDELRQRDYEEKMEEYQEQVKNQRK
jgi:hypothetical protein